MSVDTNVYPMKEDLGKNLYRKKTYYTLVVEQEVLAKDKDEADQKFLDDGGIDHSQINHEITEIKMVLKLIWLTPIIQIVVIPNI
jgi:hypothetical protein